jgi:hypothetical protein
MFSFFKSERATKIRKNFISQKVFKKKPEIFSVCYRVVLSSESGCKSRRFSDTNQINSLKNMPYNINNF